MAEQIGVRYVGPIALNAGEEYDTGISWSGIIDFSCDNSGDHMIVCGEAYPMTAESIIFAGSEALSVDLSATNKDCINKKTLNGTLFLKNNHSVQRRYRAKFI